MSKEKHRFVKNKDKKTQFSSNNELMGSDSKSKKYTFSLKSANVSILSPSFLSPSLKKLDDDLRLVILTDKLFFNTFEKSEGKKKNKAGPSLSGTVNRYLKITTWKHIDKDCHANTPIFSSNSDAIENIEVYFLWNLNQLNDEKLTRKSKDLKDEVIFAQMHSSVSQMYKDEDLVYGFEIIIKNLPPIFNGKGLFNLSWVNYKPSNSEDERGDFFELQDSFIKKFHQKYNTGYKHLKCNVTNDTKPTFSDKETIVESFHPLYIADKERLDIGHLSDVHVSSRQHVFTKSKARLIDGDPNNPSLSEEIGGLVNTSYATLKNLMKQMGNETDLLIFTGDLIDYNRNLNPNNSKNGVDKLKNSRDLWNILNLNNLKDKELYPIGIDNLIMYELFKWYYNTYSKPILLVSGNHEAYTLPYGISPRIKMSRSLKNTLFPGKYVYEYDKQGDILLDDEGFPVTKQVKLTEDEVIAKSSIEAAKDLKEIKKKENSDIYFDRANEGIPADHNLTISEAILMYGPDYARVVMAASSDDGGERNFKPENLEWFYHIFTPLSSFITIFSEQCFINLGWGNNEKFIGKKQGSWSLGGFLPRSTESISEVQLSIVNSALDEGKKCNFLCSHFTYANYNTPQPISDIGKINYNDFISTLGKHDYGTFEKNRNEIYKKISNNEIQYTLSGHSHRSALYQVKDKDLNLIRSNMSIKALTANDENIFDIKPKNTNCRMLVAACGGPIAVQNHNNELYNWGLDNPSGNYIKFEGSTEDKIGIKIPTIPQSKPRLAVALDYADIFLRGENKGGFIYKFESKEDDGPFTLKINSNSNNPNINLLNTASIILYNNDVPISISGDISYNSNNKTYDFRSKKSLRRTLLKIQKDQPVSFISFKLNKNETIDSFKKYKSNDNWNYQIEIFARSSIEIEKYNEALSMADSYDPHITNEHIKQLEQLEGYIITRNRKHGEIPSFDWYAKKYNHEYA